MDNHTAPYASAAGLYWEAGWRGVLPLPPGQKGPPPPGWTGHDGDWPGRADVQAWIEDQPGGNIALRLPADVIGLDVDAHDDKPGADTLAALVAGWGELPDTWVSSARGRWAVSGIRLFRLPAQYAGANWPGVAGPGIETIHVGHRYALVWPSTNPHAKGAVYRWRVPDRDSGGPPVPRVDRLAMLPETWCAGLALPHPRRAGVELDESAARDWLAGGRAGEACEIVTRTHDGAAGSLGVGSRHDQARDAVHALVRLAGEGHAGVPGALDTLREGFLGSVAGERGRDGQAEWGRMLLGAVRLAAADDPTPRAGCDCPVWTGAQVGFEPPPFVAGEVDRLEAALLSAAQVAALPDPVPLVTGLLDLDTLAWLIGKPGSFKSFVALALAGAVGRGLPWAGRDVREGGVLYVMAEGAGGAGLRVRAWEKHFGAMTGVDFLPVAVQARGEHWGTLIELVTRRRPALVVLDTQARISVGFRENDNSDMGEFILALDRLRRAAGSCVLVVHHIGRAGEDARGASAIDGAQDTELKISRLGGERSLYAKLEVDKQKDGADTGSILLEMVKVDMGRDEVTSRELSSLVAMPPAFAMPPAKPWRDDLPVNQQRIVDVLGEHLGILGGTRAEVRALVVERFGDMPRSSYSTAFTQLAESSIIARIGGTQRYALSSLLDGPAGAEDDLARLISGLSSGSS